MTMSALGRVVVASAVGTALVSALVVANAKASPEVQARVSPELATVLGATPADEALVVLVTGETTAAAVEAVEAAGLSTIEVFDRLAVVAAAGVPSEVQALPGQRGIRWVEPDTPLELFDDVAHRSTGVAQLRDTDDHPELRRLRRRDKTAFDGSGVSIAVIDGAFDTNHEQFVDDGTSKFDVHLRQACPMPKSQIEWATGDDPTPNDCSAWVPAPPADPDNHGTSVAAMAAGHPRITGKGLPTSGTAPGARLVGLAIGMGATRYNAVSALNWVLEHHENPCAGAHTSRADVPDTAGARSCPPIRVVNNSYGILVTTDLRDAPDFNPDSPISVASTALVDAGLVVIFAAGNDGRGGLEGGGGGGGLNEHEGANQVSEFAQHPVPGVLGVGSYHDHNSGSRDGAVSRFSSRGAHGRPATYPDVVAPGEMLLTACSVCLFEERYWYGSSGTSLAAPYVAGIVAQLVEAAPWLSPADVEDLLEDTAYQGFIDATHLEPDSYLDHAGMQRGNHDHLTSFDAGHGLVDAVGALSAVFDGTRAAPEPCPDREGHAHIGDARGDATLYRYETVPGPASGDIVAVDADLVANPGALTVVVSYDDLPEAEPRMHTAVAGYLDRRRFQAGLDRSLTIGANGSIQPADEFTALGTITVDGHVDHDADTATFVIHSTEGSIESASLEWTWTSTFIGQAETDYAVGSCPVWAPPRLVSREGGRPSASGLP